MKKPEIEKMSISFVQEANSLTHDADFETIEILFEHQLGEEEGPFFVIKTDAWSFDNVEEIKELIDRGLQVYKKEKKQ